VFGAGVSDAAADAAGAAGDESYFPIEITNQNNPSFLVCSAANMIANNGENCKSFTKQSQPERKRKKSLTKEEKRV
jgi:hypothetical protein